MRRRESLLPFLRFLIRQRIYYSRGRGWLGYIDVVLSVGVLLKYGLLALAAAIFTLTLISIFIGLIEKKLGTWQYEMEYTTQMNPLFDRIDKKFNEKAKP